MEVSLLPTYFHEVGESLHGKFSAVYFQFTSITWMVDDYEMLMEGAGSL